MIELRRSEIHERRDQHRVRLLLAQELIELPAARNRLLELVEDPRQHAASGFCPQQGQPGEPAHDRRGAFLRAAAKPRCRCIARLEKTQVVDAEAQLARQIVPGAGLARRRPADGQPGIARGETFDHPGSAHRLFAIRGQVQRVPALGELGDR
jgi:hypothetical protein